MSELILHHYETSPFSEKVRLVLGMKGLAWRSVIVPVMLPKPDVMALTGGYRRTPFLQVGRDIYCDSALICNVLDRAQPEPPLYPAAATGLQHVVAQWADSTLFWAAIPYSMQVGGGGRPAGQTTPEFLKAFGADRAAMTVGRARPGPADTGAHLKQQVAWLESTLADGRPFLMGAVPSIADFSAAQSVWFVRRAPLLADMFAEYPHVSAWYARVDAFGQGKPTAMTSGEAIDVARASTTFAPVSVAPGAGFETGAEVTVSATDYGTDPIQGILVGFNADETVVERDDNRAGRVRVHFPRLGYQVKAVKTPT